jgi:hypothetical protein
VDSSGRTLEKLHGKLFSTPFLEMHDTAADVRTCAKCLFELQLLVIIAA